MTQDEIIELGVQAGLCDEFGDINFEYGYRDEIIAFAKLVALRYEKKIADLENIICQRHWDVLQEREACAKTVETIKAYRELEKVCFKFAAKTIRARGQQ